MVSHVGGGNGYPQGQGSRFKGCPLRHVDKLGCKNMSRLAVLKHVGAVSANTGRWCFCPGIPVHASLRLGSAHPRKSPLLEAS